MSTKLTVSLQNSHKVCRQIQEQEIFQGMIKRANVLEKNQRTLATQKMKNKLLEVAELSNKYVDLVEFKKSSCINIDACIPIIKADEDNDDLSEAKLDQIKMNKRKRRRYMMSFYYSDNLVEKEEQPVAPITFYEAKDRESLKYVISNQIKPEPLVNQPQTQ